MGFTDEGEILVLTVLTSLNAYRVVRYAVKSATKLEGEAEVCVHYLFPRFRDLRSSSLIGKVLKGAFFQHRRHRRLI